MERPQSHNTSHFDRQTASEIETIADRDGSILAVPVGSLEQHGEHLPVATDTILVERVIDGALEKLMDVPVLSTPPVWCGYSPHHLALGGTISGDFATLKSHLEEIAATGLSNGFDAIAFVNGHGGNTALIETVISEVGHAHQDVDAVGVTYFELDEELITEIRKTETGGMAHGGEFETSLMLFLDPESVGETRPADYLDEPYDLGPRDLLDGGPLAVYRSFESYAESGAIGDPSLASAEKGEALFDGLTDALALLLRNVHEQNK